MLLVFLLLVASVTVAFPQECSEPTFERTMIQLKQDKGANAVDNILVTGCLTPFKFSYKKKKKLKIRIFSQEMPTIKKGAIANFPGDLSIKIEKNHINTVKEGAFLNLPKLEKVSLDDNDISCIEAGVFQNMPMLEKIALGNNKLDQLAQNTFDNLPELKKVSLRRNRLEHFHQEWFKNVQEFRDLDLSNNLITYLPKAAFAKLFSLQTLLLRENRIKEVHSQAFHGLDRLTLLDLGQNKLKVLDVSFNTLHSPSISLVFETNNITYISKNTWQSLDQLQTSVNRVYLNIRSNPLQCSCYHEIGEWGKNRHVVEIVWKCNERNPVCILPKVGANRRDECIERADEDFAEGYHFGFNSECQTYH